jgi:dehydrogenase/reductase SDR family protein 7
MNDNTQNDDQFFRDKVIWITGSSSGIGEGLAKALATVSAKLVISARNTEALERVCEECVAKGANIADIMAISHDVTDFEAIPQAVNDVLARFSRIDILINNAGLGQRSFAIDTKLEVYQRVMDVNVMGPIALTKAVLPIMIEQQSGHIAVTSSIAGKLGPPLRTGYSASKHAVMGFFDALRSEVAFHGIKVSTLVAGVVRTNVVANALQGDGTAIGPEEGLMNEGLTVEEATEIILSKLSAEEDEIIVGEGQEVQMLRMKEKDPVAFFRMIEQMAATQLYGAK